LWNAARGKKKGKGKRERVTHGNWFPTTRGGKSENVLYRRLQLKGKGEYLAKTEVVYLIVGEEKKRKLNISSRKSQKSGELGWRARKTRFFYSGGASRSFLERDTSPRTLLWGPPSSARRGWPADIVEGNPSLFTRKMSGKIWGRGGFRSKKNLLKRKSDSYR